MANLSNINNKFLFTDGDFLKIGNLAPINNISGTESGISVTNSNVASITLDNTAASGKKYVMYSDDSGKLNFYDADASSGRLVIDSSGNVGISETDPSGYWGQANNIVIDTSGNGGITIKSTSAGNGRLVFTDTKSSTAGNADGGMITYNHTDDEMRFQTNGSQRMVIDSSGNLLLNQATSRIKGGGSTTGRLELSNSDSKSYMMITGSTNTNPNLIYFVNDAAVTLTLNQDNSATFAGNQVTVDPASGDAILQLQSSTQTLRIDQNSIRTGTNNNLALFTNGNSNQLVLKQSNGYVGIGTASPSEKLTIPGNYGVGLGYKTFYSSGGTVPAGIGPSYYLVATLNQLQGTTLSTYYQYKFFLTTTGTGTYNSSVYIVYPNSNNTAWLIREVARRGTTSNHPELTVSGTEARIYNDHPNAYGVLYRVESTNSNQANTAPEIFGSDYMWQRTGSLLTYVDGNVGIGTAAPSETLEILKDGGAIIRLHDPGNNSWKLKADTDFHIYDDSGSDYLTIKNSGNVGIGETSPNAKLDVNGALKAQRFFSRNGSFSSTAGNWHNVVDLQQSEYENRTLICSVYTNGTHSYSSATVNVAYNGGSFVLTLGNKISGGSTDIRVSGGYLQYYTPWTSTTNFWRITIN